ncbi:hypothetical protein [Dietzia psychralcaliphila]|uniref:hypothetical protein n=1 Tax=Dietzia psychralcaliphila TaxID=139021 RepID=UPI001C1E19ED|nr:hypothetical protein [Dietzia psychralcaliphila]
MFAILVGVLRRGIRLSCEKLRIRTQYALGGKNFEPVRVDMMEQMEGGTRKEILFAIVGAAGAIALVYGAFWGLLGDGKGIAPFILGAGGLIVSIVTFINFRDYSRKLALNPPKQAEGGEGLGIV